MSKKSSIKIPANAPAWMKRLSADGLKEILALRKLAIAEYEAAKRMNKPRPRK